MSRPEHLKNEGNRLHILLIEVELHIPMSHSLKEKRAIVKPLLNELRRDFNLSVAETGAHDHWQQAVLAATGVSGMRKSLERLDRAFLERLEGHGDFQVAQYGTQWL